MNTELLKQYKLQFVITKDASGYMEIDASGGGVSEFLGDILSSTLANEFLIKTALYLAGGQDPAGDNSMSSEMYSGNIYDGYVYVYISHPNYPNPIATIPLQDFHDILKMWRDFLLQNGF